MMKSRHLEAATVVQDVSTGALVVSAGSNPADLDISTLVLPLSLSKLYLAASWWDHETAFQGHNSENTKSPAYRSSVDVHEMLVGGSDSAGKLIAIALRKAVGTQTVLSDLQRYGFDGRNDGIWSYVYPAWIETLTPQPASASLADLNDEQWATALSIGESHMTTTLLRTSRFLQAVGNKGIECSPISNGNISAHDESGCIAARRIVDELTAKQLVQAMLDTVKRGTANRIADALNGTGWKIGGKTGTGGRPGAPLNQQDGCFAGLIFDSAGRARFTVATFVRKGGIGGGNAAEISVAIARFLAAGSSSR
jgi:cell division protein FtsI/penicillin-binding protein 2